MIRFKELYSRFRGNDTWGLNADMCKGHTFIMTGCRSGRVSMTRGHHRGYP
jgi:hypothetical protein